MRRPLSLILIALTAFAYLGNESIKLGSLPPPSSPLLNVTEFLDVRFFYDGSYQVDRVWGLIVLSNPTSDVLSSIRIWFDNSRYRVRMVRPVDSTWLTSPLIVNQVMPGEEVVWYYEVLGDVSRFEPPLSIIEEVTPMSFVSGEKTGFRLKVSVIPRTRLLHVSFSKPLPGLSDVVVSDGTFRDGVYSWNTTNLTSAVTLTVEGQAEFNGFCSLFAGRLSFRAPGASIRLRVWGSTGAQVSVSKKYEGGWKVSGTFKNLAREIEVNLTELCLYDEVNGREVSCFKPGEVLAPGQIWTSPWVSDSPPSTPRYFAKANFTVVFDNEYSTSPSLGTPEYVEAPTVEAPVFEPEITCHASSEVISRLLHFTKSMSPKKVSPGDLVTVTISVSNRGNSTIGSVAVVDPLPNGLEYVSGPEEMREGYYWNFGDLQPGETKRITFRVRVTRKEPGTIVNRIYYEGREVASDYVEVSLKVARNVTAGAPTEVGGAGAPSSAPSTTPPEVGIGPVIEATKSVNPSVVDVGGTVTFTIRVRNVGESTAGNITIIDQLPAYLSPIKGTEAGKSASFTGGLRWIVERLEPGGEAVIAFSAIVKSYPEGGVGENTAYVNGKPYKAVFTVRKPTKEASIHKTGFVVAKGLIKYVITVSSSTGVTTRLVDILPPEGTPLGISGKRGKLAWTIAVPPGGTTAVEFKLKVADDFTGQITNVASLPEFNKASGRTLILYNGLAAPEVERILKVAIPPAVLLPLLLIFLPIIVRRRYHRPVILDYDSLKGVLMSSGIPGLRGIGRTMVSDLTLMRALSDSSLAPLIIQSVNEGLLDVIMLDDVSSLFLILETPEAGLDAEKMSSIILARNTGARLYTSSSKLGLVAISYGVEVM